MPAQKEKPAARFAVKLAFVHLLLKLLLSLVSLVGFKWILSLLVLDIFAIFSRSLNPMKVLQVCLETGGVAYDHRTALGNSWQHEQ